MIAVGTAMIQKNLYNMSTLLHAHPGSEAMHTRHYGVELHQIDRSSYQNTPVDYFSQTL